MNNAAAMLIASIGLSVLLACSATRLKQASTHSGFLAQPCAPSLTDLDVVCGTVTVPDDYARPGGRTISLDLVIFKARNPGGDPAAQFDVARAPGSTAADTAAFYAGDGEAYRLYRDVVLMDARKNTASRDIETVRQVLNYSQIDLKALPFGTDLALRYIADYPERVRTAVLMETARTNADPTLPSLAQAPVLWISVDATPGAITDGVVQALSASPARWRVTVAQAVHVAGSPNDLDTCIDRIILKFVAARRVEGVDDFCVAAMKPDAFLLP